MSRGSLQIVLLSLCCTLALAPPARSAPPATQSDAAQSAAPAQPSAPALAPDRAIEVPLPKMRAPKLEDLLQPVNDVSDAIEAAEKELDEAPGVQKELAALRARIETIQSKAKAAADDLQPRLEEVRSQIAKLGAPPTAGQPPEAPEIVVERNRLNSVAAQIDGAIKTAALVEERANQLISRVQHVRQGIFARFLLWQTQTPLQPEVWRTAANQLYLARRQIAFIAGNWWSIVALRWLGLLGVLAATALAYAGLRTVCARVFLAWRTASAAAAPPLYERAAAAVASAIAFALPAVGAACVLYAGLDETGLLYWQVERFAQSAFVAFLTFVGVSSLARAMLQPDRSRWRVFDLDDKSAGRICLAVQAIAGVYALDQLLRRMIVILSLPLSASIVSAFLASLAYAALVLLIVNTPFVAKAHAPGAPIARWRPYWLKALLVAVAALVLGAALLGYVSLARFIAGQLLLMGSGLVIIALLHLAIRAVRIVAPVATSEAMAPAASATPDELKEQLFARGLRLALNLLLVTAAVPLTLMAWGMSGSEVLSSLRAGLSGFEVGGVRVSLVRILSALVLFAALLTATRLFQRWLTARAFPRTRLDSGLANSIYTGAGYLGFAVAVLAAVAYAGFDITSLAIVAGALSVGIGFGLQGIVNNFVSGLVLLVERPIKVGDWIAVKEGEGYVRRISVRATEIETFDRAKSDRAQLRARNADGDEPHAPQPARTPQRQRARVLRLRSRAGAGGAARGRRALHHDPSPPSATGCPRQSRRPGDGVLRPRLPP